MNDDIPVSVLCTVQTVSALTGHVLAAVGGPAGPGPGREVAEDRSAEG